VLIRFVAVFQKIVANGVLLAHFAETAVLFYCPSLGCWGQPAFGCFFIGTKML